MAKKRRKKYLVNGVREINLQDSGGYTISKTARFNIVIRAKSPASADKKARKLLNKLLTSEESYYDISAKRIK